MIEDVAIQGGAFEIETLEAGKKCPPGKTRGASGRCRKYKCGPGRTRGASGRCHKLKKSGPKRRTAPSSPRYRVRGGEVEPELVEVIQGGEVPAPAPELSLTAGALEEAFQAGIEAGKRRKGRKGSKKSRSRKSRSKRRSGSKKRSSRRRRM